MLVNQALDLNNISLLVVSTAKYSCCSAVNFPLPYERHQGFPPTGIVVAKLFQVPLVVLERWRGSLKRSRPRGDGAARGRGAGRSGSVGIIDTFEGREERGYRATRDPPLQGGWPSHEQPCDAAVQLLHSLQQPSLLCCFLGGHGEH